MLENSILNTIKKLLGLEADDNDFDADVLSSINTAFFELNQIGLGPAEGFMITGPDEKWSNYIGEDANLSAVISLIWIKVRLLFDPPQMGHLIASLEKQAERLEGRLLFYRDSTHWVAPANPDDLPEPDVFSGKIILDGGIVT